MAATASKRGTRKSASTAGKTAQRSSGSPAKAGKKASSSSRRAAKSTSRRKAPGTDRRTLLEQERERLQRELDRAMARVRASLEESDLESGDENDLADAADAIYDRELGVAIAEDLRERLREVEETLKRLDESDVPRCEVCGRRISKERLRWVPSATRCAKCQGIVEGLRRPARTRELLGEEGPGE